MADAADLTKLRAVLDRLSALPTPTISLARKSMDSPTDEQVAWAALVYAYALLHHVRSLLRGIVHEIEDRNTPAALVLTRAVFELAANAYYVEKHLTQHLGGAAQDLAAAWRVLEGVLQGSRYRHDKTPPPPSDTRPVPESPHIKRMIRALNERMRPGEAEQIYSYLSEFSHPNSGALTLYFDLALVDGEQRAVFPPDPSPLQPGPPVHEARLALCVTLPMALRIAGWCDSPEASQLRLLLDDMRAAGLP